MAEQINILGDDGVPVEYHVTFWKSELIDFVILQQDAFDEIDAVTPMAVSYTHLDVYKRQTRYFEEVSSCIAGG